MTNPGEPGDDEELDSMMGSMRGIRTMFREMPDAEPPARGLDALMAAARTKAAEMAPEREKESWWRRTLAMLTRPPMLAAATVIVLVGSTVVLTRRDGSENAAVERTATRDGDAQPTKNQASAAGAKLEAGDKAKDLGGVEKTDDKPGGLGGAIDRLSTQRPRPPVVARPQVPPPPPEVAPESIIVERPTVNPTDEVEPRIVTESGEDLRGNGQQERNKPEPPKPATADPETTARPPATPTGTQPSVPQLVKQAEVAAGRNDCAAVKATAERIRQLDANAYKTRVITQAAIKRCL